MGAVGIKHKIYVGEDASIQSTFATTINNIDMHTELLGNDDRLLPQEHSS